ncbi:MAG: RNA polymerase sigma factor [Firmicutes bacterium]|nr:RNA polymerase sigma factor [Bacillota bacterium]
MRETDEQLYSRFIQSRNNEDLRELLERHRNNLTLFLFGIVHDMEDAEELMLDSFAVLVSGSPGFSGKSSFKTWLFAVGRNLALKHLRKKRPAMLFQENSNNDQLSINNMPESGLITNERNIQLYLAMDKLNPDYREVLHLIYFEDMSIEDAARIMNKTKKQVYNLSTRSRQALKDELERMGFDIDVY